MKVAMLDPSLFTGRYDDGLCAALAGEGHEVALFGRPMRGTDAIRPQDYSYHRRFFAASERLRPLLGEGIGFRAVKAAEYGAQCLMGPLRGIADADVVHVQWLPLAAADRHLLRRLGAGRKRPTLVHTVHNARPYHGDDARAAVQGRGYRALLDRFDALIAHGPETRDALMEQGVPATRVHIVPHPPMRLAQAGPGALSAVPAPALPRILFFGTIRPYKGVDVLIDACLALWRAGHRFELALAGKPFMDIAPLLDRVRKADFSNCLHADLGFLREERLDAHLRRADMLVFPYRHIDSSGAFLSALHYGKPVIASATGMFAALPDVDGEAAVALTPPGDSAALAQALLPLIESPAIRQAAGARALALGQRLGSWKEAAVRTVEVYRAAGAAR